MTNSVIFESLYYMRDGAESIRRFTDEELKSFGVALESPDYLVFFVHAGLFGEVIGVVI